MRRTVPSRPLGALQRYLRPHRHSALLAAIVFAFLVRPVIGSSGLAPVVFSIALLLLLVLALYTTEVDELVGERAALLLERHRRRLIAWSLALLAVVERVIALLWPSPRQLLLTTFFWLLFLAFVTWGQLRSLLRQREVTGETISMSVSIYLLLALTWGLVYSWVDQHDPGAFNLPPASAEAATDRVPTFIYFSLTTISTIGFGDIVPLTMPARYAAVAEGVTGQFYLAVLVARLVALQMSGPSHPKGGAE
jgi:voltage-gated potassium channel